MLPNKRFFAYGAQYALLAIFLSTIIYIVFSVEIIEKEHLQAMLVYYTLQIGKQCMCGHKHEKSPKTAFAERVIFLLVEAPPQSPANTKCVLKRSPSDCGYAIL